MVVLPPEDGGAGLFDGHRTSYIGYRILVGLQHLGYLRSVLVSCVQASSDPSPAKPAGIPIHTDIRQNQDSYKGSAE